MWYLPEHTLPAYTYAFFEGSDFIDVDLQPTADDKLLAHHDPVLLTSELANFDPNVFTADNSNHEFQNRINNVLYEEGSGWFAKDFEAKELGELKHKMRYRAEAAEEGRSINENHKRPGLFDS